MKHNYSNTKQRRWCYSVLQYRWCRSTTIATCMTTTTTTRHTRKNGSILVTAAVVVVVIVLLLMKPSRYSCYAEALWRHSRAGLVVMFSPVAAAAFLTQYPRRRGSCGSGYSTSRSSSSRRTTRARTTNRSGGHILPSTTSGGGGGADLHRWPSSTSTRTLMTTAEASVESDQNNNQLDMVLLLWDTLLQRFQGDFDNYQQVLEDRCQGLYPREGGGHEHIHCTLVPVSSSGRLACFYFDGQPQAVFRFRYYQLILSSSTPARPSSAATTTTITTPLSTSTSFTPPSTCTTADMVLYTLDPVLEQQLREHCYHPETWPEIFANFAATRTCRPLVDTSSSSSSSSSLSSSGENQGDGVDGNDQRPTHLHLLPKCEVRWSWDMDPVLHSYVTDQRRPQATTKTKTSFRDEDNDNNEDDDKYSDSSKDNDDRGMHAVMVHGEAIVDSTMMPGRRILIRDQLSLYNNELYIHDRGFDPDTMQFIYGNQKGIPYRLERVADLLVTGTTTTTTSTPVSSSSMSRPPKPFVNVQKSKKPQEQQQLRLVRQVTDTGLAWTLGPSYRTDDEYQAKVDAVGGPSLPTFSRRTAGEKQ